MLMFTFDGILFDSRDDSDINRCGAVEVYSFQTQLYTRRLIYEVEVRVDESDLVSGEIAEWKEHEQCRFFKQNRFISQKRLIW